MQARVRMTSSAGPAQPRVIKGTKIHLGRDPRCEISFDAATYPMVSGVHARVEAANGEFVLVHMSRNNKTLLNDALVESSAPLRAGDRVRMGYTGPTVEFLSIESTSAPPPEPVPADVEGSGKTIQADARHFALLRGTAGTTRFEIGAGGVIGRNAAEVQFGLEHPHVSRFHANLAVDQGRVILADLGSSNGTFVNGHRLTRPTELAPGDRIDIGPFSLQFDGASLFSRSRSNNIELSARALARVVQNRATGQPLTLLDGIDLVIRPKEFVCLLGPSGSGKSTLLAILSGRNAPNSGVVAVNGQNLYSHFEAFKEDIAVVPQRDVLHDSLSVDKALGYTAELRLPEDMSHEEIAASISDIVEVVGLTPRRGTLIRHLSGGQVKRASLANELVSRPSLLFLDEVTSGLDEQTDREMMELFREVAEGGKTVVCITHSLANVEATCSLVVVLTEGGCLAFVGTPDEAKAYFEIPRLGEVYRKLAERKPGEWHARFRTTPWFQRYVTDRLPLDADSAGQSTSAEQAAPRERASIVRQALVLIRRYVSILWCDREALLALAGQGLLIAVLLGLVFGKLADVANPFEQVTQTRNVMLLLAVSCFWFGANTAAKELVKERVIFQRERDFNLRVPAYLASKLIVLAAISLMQATILFGIVRLWCGLPGMLAAEWLTLCCLAMTGTSIGLLISGIARSEEMATALVPAVVIPQIILAGVVAPLSGLAKWLAKSLISVHWAQLALERLLPQGDLALLNRPKESWVGPFLVVTLHLVVSAALTIPVLRGWGRGTESRHARPFRFILDRVRSSK